MRQGIIRETLEITLAPDTKLLGQALEPGLSLLSPDRPGRVVLFSAGEENGSAALAVAPSVAYFLPRNADRAQVGRAP